MLSFGANVIMVSSGANFIIWCYHVMLSSGMITHPFFIFPENFTHSGKTGCKCKERGQKRTKTKCELYHSLTTAFSKSAFNKCGLCFLITPCTLEPQLCLLQGQSSGISQRPYRYRSSGLQGGCG
jgi:hypothetical protein